MGNKKVFFGGVALGIAAVIVLSSTFSGIKLVYGRYWGKDLDHETKINEIYSLLDTHYVDDYDKKLLDEAMYKGLVRGIGDPYTSYMDSKTLESFMQQTEGTYAGIGVVVTSDLSDNTILVIAPYEGSPGAKAGILPGDKFIGVNGIDVTGEDLDDAVMMMKGKPGTKVTVTVYRPTEGKTFDVEIVREQINIPTVSHKMLEGGIGYLRITNFDRVTTKQFEQAYTDLTEQEMKGLIIDLRNNPGGLLDVVVKIADQLVPKGDKGFILYTEDKEGEKEYFHSTDDRIEIPLVLIVNGNSASASEVLAGAVKDLGVGELVGTQTFGKGLVQGLFPIGDGTAVKVTIAKYYTPSGVCINGEGITPQHVVEMPDEMSVRISSLTQDEDVQLKKAVEVIQAKIK